MATTQRTTPQRGSTTTVEQLKARCLLVTSTNHAVALPVDSCFGLDPSLLPIGVCRKGCSLGHANGAPWLNSVAVATTASQDTPLSGCLAEESTDARSDVVKGEQLES